LDQLIVIRTAWLVSEKVAVQGSVVESRVKDVGIICKSAPRSTTASRSRSKRSLRSTLGSCSEVLVLAVDLRRLLWSLSGDCPGGFSLGGGFLGGQQYGQGI
jgi:hypothetical protein